MLYTIIADGVFDQVCETKEDAERERRELQEMGCAVRVKTVATWEEANAIEERMQ